jgi:hypothetical protein
VEAILQTYQAESSGAEELIDESESYSNKI